MSEIAEEETFQVQDAITWGLTYREEEKSTTIKKPLQHRHSPINVPFNFCRALEKCKKSPKQKKKNKKCVCKPHKSVKSPQKLSLLDRSALSQSQYMQILSIPNESALLKCEEAHNKKNMKKKKCCRCIIQSCSPRLIQMAVPKKQYVLETWKMYQESLSPETILRFDRILRSGNNDLDLEDARNYFKRVDRKKAKAKRRKKLQKKKLKMKTVKSDCWLQEQISKTARVILDEIALQDIPIMNHKQMIISNQLLAYLRFQKVIKSQISRSTKNAYKAAIIDLSDQLIALIDHITNVVEIQPLDSKELIQMPSLEELLEEEEEEEEGEEGELASEEESEAAYGEFEEYEGEYTYDYLPKDFYRKQGPFDVYEDQLNLDGYTEDELDKLIAILSNSPDEFLDRELGDSSMPGVTYRDILNRLKDLRDGKIAAGQTKQILEHIMVEWAKNNQPEEVDEQLLEKIHEASDILSSLFNNAQGDLSDLTATVAQKKFEESGGERDTGLGDTIAEEGEEELAKETAQELVDETIPKAEAYEVEGIPAGGSDESAPAGAAVADNEEALTTPADAGAETTEAPAAASEETTEAPAAASEETTEAPTAASEESPEAPAAAGEETPEAPAAAPESQEAPAPASEAPEISPAPAAETKVDDDGVPIIDELNIEELEKVAAPKAETPADIPPAAETPVVEEEFINATVQPLAEGTTGPTGEEIPESKVEGVADITGEVGEAVTAETGDKIIESGVEGAPPGEISGEGAVEIGPDGKIIEKPAAVGEIGGEAVAGIEGAGVEGEAAPGVAGVEGAAAPGVAGVAGAAAPGVAGVSGAAAPGVAGLAGAAAPGVVGIAGAAAPGRIEDDNLLMIIRGHKPPAVFDHSPDTICCLSLKVWAVWLLEIAHNAHNWTKWIGDIIKQVRQYAATIRGDVILPNGEKKVLYKREWREFIKQTEEKIVAWRQYSQHVKDLSSEIMEAFHGKKVTCCPKCLEDHMIKNVVVAHDTLQALTEAINCAEYWQRCLDRIVEQTSKITNIDIEDDIKDITSITSGSSSAYIDIEEISVPYRAKKSHISVASPSSESVYEIEELDPYKGV